VWHVALTAKASLEDVQSVFVFLEDTEFEVSEQDDTSTPASDTPRAEELEATPPAADIQKSANMRVPAERLDDLMDQLGKLVIAQTRLDQLANETDNTAMLAVSEEIDRLINGLRGSTLAMRMLPIEVVFGKLRRVVRSLADELGKDVTLVTVGGDTELDKKRTFSTAAPNPWCT
jgi:two-component system chemotaxis sensor kinase CheA